MSIKKLFGTPADNKRLSPGNKKEIFKDAESARNVEEISTDHERFVPHVDYSDPVNFATFGSARLYYESAIKRITDYYPYDGSDAEVNKFLNESLDIERYILKYRYPTTTGYITFARDGYAVTNIVDGYSRPTSAEYIDFKGGPGTGSAKSLKITDLIPNPENSSYKNSNIYDEDIL